MIGDPITGCRVELQDEGQDFLEFDIVDGRIQATRPFQGFVWNGRRVINASIQAGDTLVLSRKEGEVGEVLRLRYPVTRVQPLQAA